MCDSTVAWASKCEYPPLSVTPLLFRKILVSVKFVSANLGPEMAAPILWAPGKMRSFSRKTGIWGLGGGEVPILFLWARGFSDLNVPHKRGVVALA